MNTVACAHPAYHVSYLVTAPAVEQSGVRLIAVALVRLASRVVHHDPIMTGPATTPSSSSRDDVSLKCRGVRSGSALLNRDPRPNGTGCVFRSCQPDSLVTGLAERMPIRITIELDAIWWALVAEGPPQCLTNMNSMPMNV
jgi:hypothetical protein